jgi:hypothetical protein
MSEEHHTAHSEKLAQERKHILDKRFTVELINHNFPWLLADIRRLLKTLLPMKDTDVVSDDELVELLRVVVAFEFIPREGWALGVAMKAEMLVEERLKGAAKLTL